MSGWLTLARRSVAAGRVEVSAHVRQRARERGISTDDVLDALRHGRCGARWRTSGRARIDHGHVGVIVGLARDRIAVVTVLRLDWEQDWEMHP